MCVCWVLQALVGKYMDDIRSAQDELQLTKEQFESEINIRNRLVQLHEDKATEAGSKAKELEGNALYPLELSSPPIDLFGG